jgi:DNA-binding transcriptional regulator GbsR (MarR family)
MPSPDDQLLLTWVERVATFFAEQYGLPPITGRIFAWLMVCDPPEQSGAEIAAAIGASRASISTNMRLLTGAGFVRRSSRPGSRTTYFRIDDDAWENVTRRRLASIASFREVAGEGLDLLGPETARAARLRAAYEIYDWFAQVVADMPTRTPEGR